MSPLFSSVDLLLPPESSDDETPNMFEKLEASKTQSSPRKRKRKSSSELDSSITTVTSDDKESEEEKSSSVYIEEENTLQAESRARYFSESNVICSNCGLVGHLSVLCPEEVIARRCFLCGAEGHLARNCPEELCHNCLRPGHKRKECTLPRRDLKREEKHAYLKQEDIRNMKDLICYVCGKRGHLDCSFNRMKFCKIVSCYNCGQRGHSAIGCRRPRADECISVANRLVKTYSQRRRKKKQYNLKEDSICFTEQVERVLKERHCSRRMSAPNSLEYPHRDSNKRKKRRRASDFLNSNRQG
jgi:hypothetical protein